MKVISATRHESDRRSYLASASGHVLILVLALLAPVLGWIPKLDSKPEVRLVRLRGGGEMIPGWIKPTTAPADETPVSDNKPQPIPFESKPAGAQLKDQTKQAKTPAPKTEPSASNERTKPAEESASGQTSAAGAEEKPTISGAGVGAKPGPEGPGIGATSDADFTGANAYLSRIEAEVQRRFNFRGEASNKIAEYHFNIRRNGEIQDLVLIESSGVPSLDLAARSALMRAKLPPLPGSFPHDQLGVTYRFHGD